MSAMLQAPNLDLGPLTARLLPPGSGAGMDLRRLAFPGDRGDGHDATCHHLVIETRGKVLATGRLRVFDGPPKGAYAAEFYDLAPLTLTGRSLELGRFCLHPDHPDPGILRLAWGFLARIIAAEDIALLFGCTSFPGAQADHGPALAALRPHVASPGPGRRAAALPLPDRTPDPTSLPPLLRFYLSLGAKVSDHAVIDRDLDTLHVLTLLRIADIPPARARFLTLA
ncbi:GNAT family N-acetyltransferase [Rhodobacter sp. KR11]|uniref:GNAT family N-acetyltransferase n=1 Tax=Rhodobacter sp. KR11 TaxID=2974588 RepID=UPI00222238BD|nr:GNAT family N-acyltransferase [Rhodobacter sp. KR11]MCW1917791.1 GNAT family N-acetyltransferase [Rhodobacter sp. KR11]